MPRNSTLKTEGRMIGTVTRLIVCKNVAPLALLASSKEESICRKAADRKTNMITVPPKPWTKIIPGNKVNGSIGPLSISQNQRTLRIRTLTNPLRWPSSTIHPIVVTRAGIIKGKKTITYTRLRNGISVRSTNQARANPIMNETATDPMTKIKVSVTVLWSLPVV